MSKKKQVYDPNREAEMLNSQVRMDGVGEDQVVKDLLSDKFVTGTDTEVGPIALALAELLTGMKASQAQQDAIMKRLDKYERAQVAWEKDKKKFLEDIDKRSASLIVTNPLEKEKMMAQWAVAAKEAQELAAAQNAANRIKFDQILETEPKETIISSGIMETHREGNELVPYLVPEVIAIKHRKWVLPPNERIDVPHTVAVVFRERQRQREALKERQNLMRDGKTEAGVVANEWNKINEKYKLGGDAMPTPSA